jgi:hypothetical protein
MTVIELRGRINDEGKLEVEMPQGLPAGEVKVTVEVPAEETAEPKRSLLGILEDYGPAPSAEEIDEARREMWGNFPRDDIA